VKLDIAASDIGPRMAQIQLTVKRREKMYVDRLQFTTDFLPLLSAGYYSDGNFPGKHHGKYID
jgi:hypothetical protein